MKYFNTFWKRISLLLLLYSSSRILFYFFNSSSYSENVFLSILEGIRFDISALLYINIPLFIFLLFPMKSICDLTIFMIRKLGRKIRKRLTQIIKLLEYCKNIKLKRWYQKMTNIIFYIINIPFIVINNVDIEYIKFTRKRTSIDILDLLGLTGGGGEDAKGMREDAFNILLPYALDYWHVTIIIIIQIFLLLKIKNFDTKRFNVIGKIFSKIETFIRNKTIKKNIGNINYRKIISILLVLILLFISLSLSKSLPIILLLNVLFITFIFLGYIITCIFNPESDINKWIMYILLGQLLIFVYLQDIWSHIDTIWGKIIFPIYICIPIILLILKWSHRISYSNFNKWTISLTVPVILFSISNIDPSGFQEMSFSDQILPPIILSSIIIHFLTSLFMLTRFYPKQKGIKEILVFLFSCYIFILGARGGTNIRSIRPIDAGIFSNTQNSSLVLNTPFCILHSYFAKGLERKNYFTEEELKEIYPTSHQFEGNFQKKNVVIIILESFSREYVGYYNKEKPGYTPFLDEIIPHSLVMEKAYANGVKSIEALPAVTSSIPTLDYEPFLTSTYAANSYYSIASLLKEEGYSTSFFYGGVRGSMGFYQFSKKAGFDNYYGLEEYGKNDEDNDGVWGLYDGPFFEYFSEKLDNKIPEPFVSLIFSITSHPPFTLPEEYENKFDKGDNDYHESIGYTDEMLRDFFERAKNQEWYKNTLFVFTADHCSGDISEDLDFVNGEYSIPIIYFMGDSSLAESNSTITQQIDIMPTILHLLKYNKPFFSFGKSVLKEDQEVPQTTNSWAISNMYYDKYVLIHEDGFLFGRDEEYTNYSDSDQKEETKINEDAIKLLKAIKQKYNNSLIDNKMTINED